MISPIKNSKIEYDIRTYRNHRKESVDASAKYKVGAGAIVGTFLPMLFIAKKQKANVFKIKYDTKEMMMLSSGAILGGLFAGLLSGKKEHRKQKLHEGVFQFLNATVPTLVTAGLLSFSKKYKQLEKTKFKALTAIVGLGGGMYIASKLANIINDPYDKVPDRKLTIKDSVANIDDAVGILVVTKVPFANKLQVEKALPAVYGLCGYRAGMSN